ncbi:MAG: DNA-3-methyladenine glycosylase [Bacteroidetes bacterium]|nr:DNA-3-methyladenine glycosylase [Bacteroidota bacterium]MBU1116012.1 DNA-3-methyladenine glycosylase [Bacteroidota bacterium]MBU1799220.1 DNA-3-methyladenine glycosylase [Bacteroidota bacterium]
MIEFENNPKLELQFYNKPTVEVAKNLLGKILVKNINGILLAGIIVETEAYLAQNDEASHSYKGLSYRNKTMFKTCGHLYVYQIYGIHFCCNIVTGKENVGEAVLIRAIEPISNIELMNKNRFGEKSILSKNIISLTNGPAKLCEALAITNNDDGVYLLENNIYILDFQNIEPNKIVQTERVGITKSKELLLRFYIKDNLFVSKK